jgi:serine/threonine-protein kinase
MRWNPFRRADSAANAESTSFESTVVDDSAAARLAAAQQDAPADAGAPAATPAPPAPPKSATASIAEAPSIGHIGRYALKTVLGQGGLGTVYAAWDPLLSRTVAVKTLHIDADPSARESLDALFLNEARAAAGLSHPHIVTVFDAGPSESGVYIAMERLQGQDLRHLLQQGVRPSPIESVQVVRRVADALAYAHRKGVVHCDIKPANIFMVGRMHPKVLDFGIARIAHREASPLLDGVVAGSPYYLAPEQIDGRSVDRRSDVYSLGVVLYELLAGKRPFDGKSLDDIQRAVKAGDFQPAHRASSRVPLGLSVIASRAMAHDPDQRFPSARHLSMELRHWLESAEARALLNGSRAPSPEPLSQRLLRFAGPVAGITALVLACTLWWVKSPNAKEARVAAEPAAASAPVAQEQSPDAEPVAQAATTTVALAPVPASPSAPAPIATASTAAPPSHATHESQIAAIADVAPASAGPNAGAAANNRKRKGQQALFAQGDAPAAAASPALGVVQLAVSPWGQVEVDGQAMGTSPPLTKLTLTAGQHMITVRNADFPSFTTTLNVNGENPVTLRHRFGQ